MAACARIESYGTAIERAKGEGLDPIRVVEAVSSREE
jgi:hypothetical protein